MTKAAEPQGWASPVAPAMRNTPSARIAFAAGLVNPAGLVEIMVTAAK